jgi:hypothetical protein
MKRITCFIFVFTVIAFSSCNKLDIQKSDNNKAVIECYIQPGHDLSVSIRKELGYNSEDTVYHGLNDLEVILSDGINSYTLINSGEGLYIAPEVKIQENQGYKLEFNYNEKKLTATTTVPGKPENFRASATVINVPTFGSGTRPEMPEPVTLSWSNPNEEYFMLVVENTEENPVLINASTDRPIRVFRNTPTQGSSQELPPMSFTYTGQHRVILFKLNAEYAALYEQLSKNSLDIKAPPSNIVNGLGIFTGINSDTINIKVVSK